MMELPWPKWMEFVVAGVMVIVVGVPLFISELREPKRIKTEEETGG